MLQWRTDTHHFLAMVSGGLTENVATHVCTLPSHFYFHDYVAGLADLSGFCVTLNPNSSNFHITYIQAYMTDKSLIAHLEAGRHGLFMWDQNALHKDGDNYTPTYCNRMMEIYWAGICHTTAAQLEARVLACAAVNTMLGFPQDLLECTLC